MNKHFESTVEWIKNNRQEFLVIAGILLISAFLRFYRISEYMTFLGDEGRDAIVVKDLLVNHHFPLIGPPTSIGNMYLGPAYYYMMAVPMAIFWLNPVAAAVMTALIGILTVCLIYLLSRLWFGPIAAVVASFLYSISPVVVYYSRSSWNPNPAPFFALIAFLSFHQIRQSKNFVWLGISGISIALAAQMHYLALILIPIFIILWLFELVVKIKYKPKRKNFRLGTILAVFGFLLVMSPLILFDLRHDFLNYKAISTFFLNRETTVNLNPFNTLIRIWPILESDLIGRYMTAGNQLLTGFVSALIIYPFFVGIWLKLKRNIFCWVAFVPAIWLFVGVLGLALYKQTIYDHYLGFLAPSIYILIGCTLDTLIVQLKNYKKYQKIAITGTSVLVIFLAFVNLQKNPLLSDPNNQLKRTQDVSKFVIGESQNKPFNFALIAEHNYDAAYQYYLDLYRYKPKKVPFEITDQLFVVCEDIVCKPVGHPKYEIAGFGWAKIENEQNFDGVRVFKLVHNPSGKP